MGCFSWMYCDTDNKEALLEGGEAYVALPSGGYIYEPSYDDYGHFGGFDIYDLVADWNREYLSEHPNFMVPQHGMIPDPDHPGRYREPVPKMIGSYSWYKKYANLNTPREEVAKECALAYPDWRAIGIEIACYDDQNAALPYPIKICKYPPKDYFSLPSSDGDPNQGWGSDYDKEDDE